METLLSTSLGQSFIDLFTGLPAAVLFLILTGLMLIVIETFRYSKRVFGVTGFVLIVAGIVLRMLANGTPAMLFMLLLFCTIVIFVSHLFKLRLQKREWLFQSLRLAIGEEQQEQIEDYEFLTDSTGIAVTDIDGKGKAAVNDIQFIVCSGHFIASGSKVRIVAVDGDKIFVKKEE